MVGDPSKTTLCRLHQEDNLMRHHGLVKHNLRHTSYSTFATHGAQGHTNKLRKGIAFPNGIRVPKA